MIKFAIGLITLVFVALAVYTLSNKKEVVAKSAVTHKVVKEEVTKVEVEKPAEVVKEVITETKPMAKKSIKVEKVMTDNTSENIDTSSEISELSMESSAPEEKIEEETPEAIMQIESDSGLMDLSDDDETPMETEKVIL